MRGQWINYDNFNLIELIDEVKTRVNEPFRVDDILHEALIVGKNYQGMCKKLRRYLELDDKKEDWIKNLPTIAKYFDVDDIYSEYTCEFQNEDEVKQIKNAKPLTEDKKKILKDAMGSCSSKIDFNKVRDEYKYDLNLGFQCSNCGFDLFIYHNQTKVVCEHCNTINYTNGITIHMFKKD